MRRILHFILGLFLSFSVYAGELRHGTINGYVYNSATGETLIGANVFLAETSLGAAANISGYYVIPRITPGQYTVVCRYMGYSTFSQSVTVESNSNITINIRMDVEDLMLQQIIVSADSIRTVEKLFNKQISEIQLGARQIRSVPQVAEADLLRTLQTMPGIQAGSDFSSGLYIRGGTPSQNLYILDGTDVYNPEHAFGLFSTFNTDAIKHVEVHKGGFGAEYGGRLSSVIDITHLDGNREYTEGIISLSLLSAKATFQTPLGSKGSLSGSFRRTYFDQTVAKMIDDLPDYTFFDGNIKAFFELDPRNKLTISAYGGKDVLNFVFNNDASDKRGFHYHWGNQTGSIRWTRVFSPKLFSNFWITGSRFFSKFDMPVYEMNEKNIIEDLTVKGNIEHYISNQFNTQFGFEHKRFDGVYKTESDGGIIDIQQSPEHTVLYAQMSWSPSVLWNINGGLRWNRFNDGKVFENLAPRFSVTYRLSDTQVLKAATGKYYQYLHQIHRFLMADIWSTSNRHQLPSESSHYILGYKKEIGRYLSLEVEGFYKNYKNLYAFNENANIYIDPTHYNENGVPVLDNTQGIFNRGDGHSAGFELFIRKDVGKIYGWIGYSFSRTRVKFDGINSNRYFAPRHDRTHTVNCVLNYKIGNWSFGMNLIYGSGQPITEPGSAYLMRPAPDSYGKGIYFAPTHINNVRLPYYARMDFSVTWTKQYSGWSMEPYLQIFNLGNRKNVWFINYDYPGWSPEIKEQHMMPLLPTIGLNIRF